MKKIRKLIQSETFLYLFFGVLTTILSSLTRIIAYFFWPAAVPTTLLGDAVGITFAFLTNDTIVFRQERAGWPKRLYTFILSRLATTALNALLSYIFVSKFPGIIGQFVGHDLQKVNLIELIIAQVIIIVLNYILSKLFVFTNKKEEA